ncbi:MAG: lysoplasmalogenase [Pseudobutyrivibrio sp.]|nr:lysoplasmalogenase [Pseudobutyrivibrio sp.]
MIVGLVIYGLMVLGLLAVCDNDYSKTWYLRLKTLCSLAFIIIYLVFSGRGLIIALLACGLGDIFMALYHLKAKKIYMFLGMLTFMTGHIFLLIYMCSEFAPTAWLVFIIPVFICLCMLAIYKGFHLHMGRLFYAAIIYCYFVSAMATKAIEIGIRACVQATESMIPILIMIAGILFFLSDFSIMIMYFYHFHNRRTKRLVHYFELISYYTAIILFVISSIK